MKKMIGKRFGRLVVLNSTKRKNLITKRKCLCDCGKEVWITTSALIIGHTKSCGCYREDFRKLPKGIAVRNQLLDDYKRGAIKRNLVWEITDSHFYKLLSGKCYYCNSLPNTTRIARRFNGDFIYNGIDRIDNTIGYTKENIVSCCKICNRAKGNMKLEDFIKWIKKLTKKIHE